MTSPTNAYRTSQVLTASPAERIVLLYQGAIRFSRQQVDRLARGEQEEAHAASLRAQEIVAALRETLDLAAGPIAGQLDALYAFCLDRLMAGNLRSDARAVEEAIQVLQGLLESWQQVAVGSPAAGSGQGATLAAAAPARPVPAEPPQVAPPAVTVGVPTRIGSRGAAAYASLAR